jgi:hypothetical protein
MDNPVESLSPVDLMGKEYDSMADEIERLRAAINAALQDDTDYHMLKAETVKRLEDALGLCNRPPHWAMSQPHERTHKCE